MRNQKPIGHDRKLRQPQAAKNQIFWKKLFFPQINIGLFRDSGLWYCRGVWKGILFTAAKIKATHGKGLFTAAKIKATHGKGADFYRQHLANNDYYSEHDRVEGHWRGSFASAFGLENESVAQDVFSLFQQNLNPSTKQKLTPRNHPNSVRFYDFQCSAQKSVSVMSLFDSRLVEAHRKAPGLFRLFCAPAIFPSMQFVA